MASSNSQSGAFAGKSLQFQKAGDSEDAEEVTKARKNQSAWVVGAAVLRLTKMCAPKCLDYSRVQVAKEEQACLDNCVKTLHGVNESTMRFMRDFEAEATRKQTDLVRELEAEVASEKASAKQVAREKRKREAGYVRL